MQDGAKSQDRKAARLGHLYVEHADAVRRFLVRRTGDVHLSEDLLQETFVRAFGSAERLDDDKALGWLLRVASRLHADHCREAARSRRLLARVAEDVASDDEPGDHVLRQQTADEVRECLGRVAARHRRLLFLRNVEGLPYARIAEVEGIAGEAARSVLARARRSFIREWRRLRRGLTIILPAALARARTRIARLETSFAGAQPLSLMQAGALVAALGMVAGGGPLESPRALAGVSVERHAPEIGDPAVSTETIAVIHREPASASRALGEPGSGGPATRSTDVTLSGEAGDLTWERETRVNRDEDRFWIERGFRYEVEGLTGGHRHGETFLDCGTSDGDLTRTCKRLMGSLRELG